MAVPHATNDYATGTESPYSMNLSRREFTISGFYIDNQQAKCYTIFVDNGTGFEFYFSHLSIKGDCMMDSYKKMVLLIDADNAQLMAIERIIQEISAFGRIVVKRAYGNWKKETLKNWEEVLKRLAIKAEQQFDYVAGKNATDMALTIDAINLLHQDIYDAFAIVSSDSDFTPLAINLHESGVFVIGVGNKQTPESFRNSCDEFVFVENLVNSGSSVEPKDNKENKEKTNEEENQREDPVDDIDTLHSLLKLVAEREQDDEGFVNVSSAGSYIKRVKPDFDIRSYGYSKLPEFINSFPDLYELKRYKGKGTVTIVAYKCKQ